MTRPTLPRPTLLPGLRPLWRDRHTVQLGTDPDQAMLLEFPHPAAAKLLELLDGSHTETAIVAQMGRIGMAAGDVHDILTEMIEAGLVVAAHTLMPPALPAGQRKRIAREAGALALRFRDRPTSPATILRRRYAARVIIADDGPIAAVLAPALLEAGVGKVGRVTQAGGTATSVESGQSKPVRTEDAFVVQVGRMARVPVRGARQRNPHLAITVRDAVAIVGPLVPPTGGPCLRCLELHRTDRDPAWPRLADQLAQAPPEPVPLASATLLTAAGFAAAEILAYLDGGLPGTIGTTVEITGGAPWRRRTWTAHATCDCTRRSR